jgi:capsular polysaccharide biosynthesis protein
VELEAESKAHRTWTPVLQVPEETVAIATFQWRRVPLTRPFVARLLAIAAAIIVLCGAFAYGVSSMGAKSFGSRSEILYPLNAAIASGSFLREDRTLSTQLVAIKSRTVLTPVAEKYNMTVDELSKKVVVSILQDSEVIRIEVDDASQAKAELLVAAIANKYLSVAAATPNAAVEQHLQTSIDAWTAQRDRLTGTLAGLQAQNPGGLATAQEQTIQSQLNDLNNQISGAQTQLNTATVDDIQTPHVQQLTQPYDVGKVAPKPLRAGIAGALAGMMIAAGVVVLLIRRRLRQLPVEQFG